MKWAALSAQSPESVVQDVHGLILIALHKLAMDQLRSCGFRCIVELSIDSTISLTKP